MNEEELKAKAQELEEREGEVSKKEQDLNDREAKLAVREADAGNIAAAIKEEYEKKLEAQKAEYEERLKTRDDMIRQLAAGKVEEDENSPFAQLNKHRLAQRSA